MYDGPDFIAHRNWYALPAFVRKQRATLFGGLIINKSNWLERTKVVARYCTSAVTIRQQEVITLKVFGHAQTESTCKGVLGHSWHILLVESDGCRLRVGNSFYQSISSCIVVASWFGYKYRSFGAELRGLYFIPLASSRFSGLTARLFALPSRLKHRNQFAPLPAVKKIDKKSTHRMGRHTCRGSKCFTPCGALLPGILYAEGILLVVIR